MSKLTSYSYAGLASAGGVYEPPTHPGATSLEQRVMNAAARAQEVERLRGWLRAVQYRCPESAVAALRGDPAPDLTLLG